MRRVRPEIKPSTVLLNVNRQQIDRNTKHGTDDAAVRIQKGKSGKAVYCHEAAILDANGEEVARLVYNPEGALVACGARMVLICHHGARPVEPVYEDDASVDTAVNPG